jgi:hypothetical protein
MHDCNEHGERNYDVDNNNNSNINNINYNNINRNGKVTG